MQQKLLAWISDPHLNLTTQSRIKNLCKEISHEDDCIGIVITGDIAESDSVLTHLITLKKEIDLPIYFVLGNHDYYNSSIIEVYNNLNANLPANINWLTDCDFIRISSSVAIVGHDNWWDGRAGSLDSMGLLDGLIMAPDYTLIKDVAWKNKEDRFVKLREMADDSADKIIGKLSCAFRENDEIILCVHVPPFEQSCEHNGKKMANNWLPHFCHKKLGDMLIELMKTRQNKKLTVLAGHTHESTVYRPLKNLKVKVASANYFKPKVYKFIKIQ